MMLTARSAAAIGYKVRLLERIRDRGEGMLMVPCPRVDCPGMVTVFTNTPDGSPFIPGRCAHHAFRREERECVEILVAEYEGWFKQMASEPLPF